MTQYLVTGASGQLGGMVMDQMAVRVPRTQLVALVRTDGEAAHFAARQIPTRRADYDDLEALVAALEGIDRLLLISSPAIGQRLQQHQNVIFAATQARVGFVAYTSMLHAGSAGMVLAEEHVQTERTLAASGMRHTLLRNAWYSENLLLSLQQDLNSGCHYGAAGEGVLSTASRHDLAEAAATVLHGGYDGEILELAGDTGFTLTEYARLLTTLSGRAVSYVDMPEAAYRQALVSVGIPDAFAAILADTHAKAAKGALCDTSKTLSRVIGRATTTISQSIATALE